jgi:hypothetical protein
VAVRPADGHGWGMDINSRFRCRFKWTVRCNCKPPPGAWILRHRSALIENCVAFCEAAAITWAGFSPNCAENIDGAQRFGVVDPKSASAYCGHHGTYRDWYGEFPQAPITRMPNVDVPVIAVVITQFGASPAELESQVTKKVEDAVAGVEGVAVRFRYVAFKTCECVHALQTEGEGA